LGQDDFIPREKGIIIITLIFSLENKVAVVTGRATYI
jgi:hypothetical protein